MKMIIDTDAHTLTCEHTDGPKTLDLYSRDAFEILSHHWLKVGWQQRHMYTFTWLGRPIIQLPEDMIRLQEAIFTLQPDIIIETGVAFGGSLLYSATLCKLIGKGRVIGIDVDIRKHNRKAIESHSLSPYITLIEGNSTDPQTISAVKSHLNRTDSVLVILDSNHTKPHVLAELAAYSPLVTPNSYIIVTDGFLEHLHDVPGGKPDWRHNNPKAAALEFLQSHPDFELRPPTSKVHAGQALVPITLWPSAWLHKKPII